MRSEGERRSLNPPAAVLGFPIKLGSRGRDWRGKKRRAVLVASAPRRGTEVQSLTASSCSALGEVEDGGVNAASLNCHAPKRRNADSTAS